MPFLDDQAVGQKVALLRAEAKHLSELADELLDGLGLNEPGEYISGDYIIKIRPTVRFDAATAERNLTPEEFDKIQKRSPNAALAKAVLSEERYKKAQKTHGLTRTVERVEAE